MMSAPDSRADKVRALAQSIRRIERRQGRVPTDEDSFPASAANPLVPPIGERPSNDSFVPRRSSPEGGEDVPPAWAPAATLAHVPSGIAPLDQALPGLGLPLGSTAAVAPCVMVNLISAVPPLDELLGLPGAHVHLYGKEPRAGRKVGHLTLVDPEEETVERAIALADG